MYCVILAAGRNTRLDTGKPKSLLTIKGISILERHIRNFSAAGVSHFCIITGYNAGAIEEFVPHLAQSYGVQIDMVHNPRFDLENGYSLGAAGSWVAGRGVKRFFLTMGDHAFHADFVRDFVVAVASGDPAALTLAVDKPGEWNVHIDLEDVTKVLTDGAGHIVEIGKALKTYDFYDTGLFCLKAEAFEALEKCFADGRYTLSDLVTALAGQKHAHIKELTGYLWNDVDNPDDLDKSLKMNFD